MSWLTSAFTGLQDHIAKQLEPLFHDYESDARLLAMPTPRSEIGRQAVQRHIDENRKLLDEFDQTVFMNPGRYVETQLDIQGRLDHDHEDSNLNEYMCAGLGGLIGMVTGKLSGYLFGDTIGKWLGNIASIVGSVGLGFLGLQYGDEIAEFVGFNPEKSVSGSVARSVAEMFGLYDSSMAPAPS